MNFNFYSGFLFALSLGLFTLFIYSLFQNRNRLSSVFSLLCLVMMIYSFFYGFELMAVSGERIMFLLKLEYVGVPFIPILWFLLAYRFYFQKPYSLRYLILLFLIPVITLVMINTNEYHHLQYKSVAVIPYKDIYVVKLEKGIWYFIASFYSYVALFTGQFLFLKAWMESKGQRRIQAKLLLAGSIFPFVVSIFYLTGMTPGGIDPMPLSYMIVSLFYHAAVFRYGFLEMKEVIRESAFEHVNEGIIVTDIEGRVIDFNKTGRDIFPWLGINNLGINLRELSEGLIDENKDKCEVKYKDKHYEFRTTYIKEKNTITGKIYIFQDITERKNMVEKLEYNARHDFLTSTCNRHHLFETAEVEIYKAHRYKKPVSLLMMDIDFFKKINDTYGHTAGDTVIKSVAEECMARLRPSDIIGRYGGEEFLIILTDTPQERAAIVAESIREKIEGLKIKTGNNEISVTVSIGVAGFDGRIGKDLQQIINNADTAMYKAKNNGRNRVEIYKEGEK